MEWTEIATFLKDTVWGVIILGALGSGLLLLILNLVAKANKKIRVFWIFYKQGRKKVIVEIAGSKERLAHARWNSLFLLITTSLSLSTGIFEIRPEKTIFSSILALILTILSIGVLILAIFQFTIVFLAGVRSIRIAERKSKKP